MRKISSLVAVCASSVWSHLLKIFFISINLPVRQKNSRYIKPVCRLPSHCIIVVGFFQGENKKNTAVNKKIARNVYFISVFLHIFDNRSPFTPCFPTFLQTSRSTFYRYSALNTPAASRCRYIRLRHTTLQIRNRRRLRRTDNTCALL